MEKIVIQEEESGQRLDKYLAKYYKEIPYAHIQKLIRNKDVKVNDRRAKPDLRLVAGDVLSVYVRRTEEKKELVQQEYRLAPSRIVYEDADILVYDKAVFESAQGGTNVKNDLSAAFAEYLVQKGEYAPEVQRTYTPSFVNRLDTNTMGLMIGAKNYLAAKKLNRLNVEGKIKKYYTALLCGAKIQPGTYAAYLLKDEQQKIARIFSKARDGAKEISTQVLNVASNGDMHLCKILLNTGRFHQIRAHMAFLGCPVAGDRKYGDATKNEILKRRYHVDNQLLKADEIVIVLEEDTLRFKVAAPPIFEQVFSGRQ